MEKVRRSWNWALWAGFVTALLAAGSYVPVFTRFDWTRDFPWANLALFLGAGLLLGIGLRRAYGQSARYRGKISGPILAVLSLAMFAMFCFGTFYFARLVPRSEAAPRVGQQAPEFTLAGLDEKPVTLSGLRQANRYVLLIFYRGYW
jgi:hypothetical protein